MKMSKIITVSICLWFSGCMADVSPAELELTRTYFAMGTMATRYLPVLRRRTGH